MPTDPQIGHGSDATSSSDPRGMSFGGHLEDLRRRVVWALLGVALAACVTLPLGRRIVGWLCVPLIEAQRAAGVTPGTYVFSPLGGFGVYLKVAVASALVLAFPWVVYQGWRFVSSGLYEHERRVVSLITPLSAALTALAVAFVYYAMLPLCLWFLISFSVSYPPVGSVVSEDAAQDSVVWNAQIRVPVVPVDPVHPGEGQIWFHTGEHAMKVHAGGATRVVGVTGGGGPGGSLVKPMLEVGKYLQFAVVLGVGVVAGFQLPVVMLILAWAGIVRADVLRRYRKHCVFGCFAVGALLTPADVLSMIVLSVPLWLLFEFGLLLMWLAERRRSAMAEQ